MVEKGDVSRSRNDPGPESVYGTRIGGYEMGHCITGAHRHVTEPLIPREGRALSDAGSRLNRCRLIYPTFPLPDILARHR